MVAEGVALAGVLVAVKLKPFFPTGRSTAGSGLVAGSKDGGVAAGEL